MNAERLENLLGELFSLEVNTILKPGMTATKVPNAAHALIDTARDYALALNRSDDDMEDLPGEVVNVAGEETFFALRERAARIARKLQGLPDDAGEASKSLPTRTLSHDEAAQLLILSRVRDTSDQLRGIVPKGTRISRTNADEVAEKLNLTDRQSMALRKAWELSTEEVVMQTVVYLDGDVITRIRPDCLLPEKRPLLDVHQEAVGTSIAFWRGLVDVVRALFSTIVSGKSPQ